MRGSLAQTVELLILDTSMMSEVSLQHQYHFIELQVYCTSGKREIQQLQVRCTNTERGCQWTGTVGTLDDHIASCQFALVPCPNKCEEDKGAGELLLIRKHLDQHLKTKCPKRAYKCSHCGEKGTFTSVTEDHDQVCEKKIVACPKKRSGCSLSMERGKTKEHVSSDCEYTEVACVYEGLGCGARMLRKDRAAHENEAREKHFDLCMATVTKISVQLEAVSGAIKLSDMQQKSLLKTVALKDEQHERLIEENKTLSLCFKNLLMKNETLSRSLESLSMKHKQLSEKHDTLLKFTRKELVIFQLPQFCSKVQQKATFYSEQFYTYSGGNKMRIAIYPNGNEDGERTHVSVFAEQMTVLYGDGMHYYGTVTIEVLNQLQDNNHHSMNIRFDACRNLGSNLYGYTKFLSHSSLGLNPATNTQYLLDDALYFRVSVEMDFRKPWLVCTHSKFISKSSMW